MLQFKEFCTPLDMITVGMGEGYDVEIVVFCLLQFLFQLCIQVDFGCIGIFGFLSMTEVKQDSSLIGQNYLSRVTVTDGVKDDFVSICHVMTSQTAIIAITR